MAKPATIRRKRMTMEHQRLLSFEQTADLTVDDIGRMSTGALKRLDPRLILNAAAGNVILRQKGEPMFVPPTDTAIANLIPRRKEDG